MKKRLRLIITVIVLSLSIALLVWGYAPNPREIRIQPIAPAEMQLPAP
ncbi:MAG: hypothetical protein HY865_15165 [Chloroflexi bacterium]|jgi:hypothetical protein|nr:hypothetical protein [Chloroflexota bacterium]